MAVRFAITGGTFSNPNIWDNGQIPLTGDVIYTNGFAINMDSSATVNSLNNTSFYQRVPNGAIPIMTSNNTPSGIAAASSIISSGFDAWFAFDGSTGTRWQSGAQNTGWLRYQFTTPRTIRRYAVSSAGSGIAGGTSSNISSWTFEGSNDATNWTILDTRTGLILADFQYSDNSFTNNTGFTFYRINVTATRAAGNNPNINDLQMTESSLNATGSNAGGSFNFNTSGVTVNTTGINAISSQVIIRVTHTSGLVQLTSTNTPSLAVTTNVGNTYMTYTGNGDFTITAPSLNCPTGGSGDQGAKILMNKSGAGRLTVNADLIYNFAAFAFDGGRVIGSTLGDIVINGNLSYLGAGGNSGGSYVINQSNGSLTITGNINAPTGFAITNNSTVRFAGSLLTINGNLLPNAGLSVNTSSPMILNGSVTGNSSTNAIISTSSINVNGNVVAANAAAISNTSSALISVTGNVTASATANAISHSGQVYLNGNMTNVNGKMAIYAPIIWLDQTGTTQARFFTSGGADRTLYSDNTFPNQPPLSDVRYLTQFGPSSGLTGTLRMASPSDVRSGVATDNTVGTALFDTSQLLAELNASSDPIAQRLRKVATPEILGQLLAAYKR